jgi:hypothetical protein
LFDLLLERIKLFGGPDLKEIRFDCDSVIGQMRRQLLGIGLAVWSGAEGLITVTI